jgi:hypothetical protein
MTKLHIGLYPQRKRAVHFGEPLIRTDDAEMRILHAPEPGKPKKIKADYEMVLYLSPTPFFLLLLPLLLPSSPLPLPLSLSLSLTLRSKNYARKTILLPLRNSQRSTERTLISKTPGKVKYAKIQSLFFHCIIMFLFSY